MMVRTVDIRRSSSSDATDRMAHLARLQYWLNQQLLAEFAPCLMQVERFRTFTAAA